MKQRISLLLAALVLTCALTACGSKQNNNDTSTPNHGDDGIVTAPDTTPGESPSVSDGSDSSEEKPGVPIDEMLENAKVHDKDGDLTDGENHTTSGADHW